MDWENLFDVDELTDQLANMQDAGDGENLELRAQHNIELPPSTWFWCSSVWSIQQLCWPFSTYLALMAPSLSLVGCRWLAEKPWKVTCDGMNCWARRFLRSARTYSFPARWGTWSFSPKRPCSAETKAIGALCQYQSQHWRGVRGAVAASTTTKMKKESSSYSLFGPLRRLKALSLW